ncbi:hypothetical protein XENTR_v10024322 [Xenopus tropicalis]|nr:hypothetical protein XENTR_v10024322 [Xenopus tropicalis]
MIHKIPEYLQILNSKFRDREEANCQVTPLSTTVLYNKADLNIIHCSPLLRSLRLFDNLTSVVLGINTLSMRIQ